MCTHGLCGTCLTGVLERQPDYRDYHLTNSERQVNYTFTLCCSCSGTLLLALDL